MFTGATLLLGCNATYEQLRRAAPRTRLLHIASHGYFRADNPRLSGIHLGDFHVSAHDLAQLQLSADLVALSGCATGLNAVSGADELIGLERALLSAGARSLLLSLWDVHDESAAEFMKCFYAHFQNGSGASQSVRRAALEIKRRYPHPYYWAPFFIVGNHGCVG
jgi:CHAT domain-containing protein